MQDLNDKNSGDSLTAAEWNEVPSEIQNVIEGLGITLSGGDLNQLGQGIAGYVVNGDFGTDSGAADAYVVTEIGGKQKPPAYTDGFRLSFRVGNTNTGASTVNAFGLGVKNIFYRGGALVGGELITGLVVNLVYDFTNGRFDIVPNLSNTIIANGDWVINNNVGIGVTPKAWDSSFKALQINTTSFFAAAVGTAFFGENAYYDGSWKYTTTSAATRYSSGAGDHIFDVAASGTADTVISWTEAMKLNADGGFVIGAPGASSLGAGTLNVENQLAIGASVDSGVAFFIEDASTEKIRIQSTSVTGNVMITFYQTTTERARIRYSDTDDALSLVSNYGRIELRSGSAGSPVLRSYLDPDGGQVNGTPTGASQGAGTINAENGLFVNGEIVPRVSDGTYTTPSLAAGVTDTTTIAHGLGTDDVTIIITGEGNAGGNDTGRWVCHIGLFDGSQVVQYGTENDGTVVIGVATTPATGDFSLRTRNYSTAATQTITIRWTAIARD